MSIGWTLEFMGSIRGESVFGGLSQSGGNGRRTDGGQTATSAGFRDSKSPDSNRGSGMTPPIQRVLAHPTNCRHWLVTNTRAKRVALPFTTTEESSLDRSVTSLRFVVVGDCDRVADFREFPPGEKTVKQTNGGTRRAPSQWQSESTPFSLK